MLADAHPLQTDLKLKAFSQLKAMLPTGSHAAIAVSGGADSMALALLMKEWGAAAMTALIVDHGLREESAIEADRVKAWLVKRGIDTVILKGEGLEKGAGMPERARAYRYRLMLDWCHAHHIRHLLLGHHADDQRETILMRLIRASSVDGLAGMKPASKREEVNIVRPLLGASKNELISYLRSVGQEWVEDPTNINDAYTRNRVRGLNAALSKEGLSPERLSLIHENLSRTSHYLAEQTFNYIQVNGALDTAGYAWINHASLQSVHEEIRLRSLKKIISYVNGGTSEPRFEEVKRLLYDVLPVVAGTGKEAEFKGATLAHAEFILKGDTLYAMREFSRMAALQVQPGEKLLFDSRYEAEVSVRLPEGSYRIAPLAKAYLDLPPAVLKRHEHFPKKLLMTFPALFHLEGVAAVPHMEWTASERYKDALTLTYLSQKTDESAC